MIVWNVILSVCVAWLLYATISLTFAVRFLIDTSDNLINAITKAVNCRD